MKRMRYTKHNGKEFNEMRRNQWFLADASHQMETFLVHLPEMEETQTRMSLRPIQWRESEEQLLVDEKPHALCD